MTFDSHQGVVQCFSTSAWMWDGRLWRRCCNSVLTNFFVAAYDSLRGKNVLFGNDPDLTAQEHWEVGPIPSGCPSPIDVNADGVIDVDDLIAVINAWGGCTGCPEDINGDGLVNIDDLLAVILNWRA
jgi:hypothetical protein